MSGEPHTAEDDESMSGYERSPERELVGDDGELFRVHFSGKVTAWTPLAAFVSGWELDMDEHHLPLASLTGGGKYDRSMRLMFEAARENWCMEGGDTPRSITFPLGGCHRYDLDVTPTVIQEEDGTLCVCVRLTDADDFINSWLERRRKFVKIADDLVRTGVHGVNKEVVVAAYMHADDQRARAKAIRDVSHNQCTNIYEVVRDHECRNCACSKTTTGSTGGSGCTCRTCKPPCDTKKPGCACVTCKPICEQCSSSTKRHKLRS